MCGLRVSKLTRIFIWFLFFDTCLCEVLFKIVFIYFFWGGGADVSFTVLQKTARIAGGERGQKYQYSQAFRSWHDPSPTPKQRMRARSGTSHSSFARIKAPQKPLSA